MVNNDRTSELAANIWELLKQKDGEGNGMLTQVWALEVKKLH